MSVMKVIDALSIPPDARVDQRVPKKLLLEQDIPTSADKRQIQDGIEELLWVAALKPTNIGVSAFRDNMREYLEISVLTSKFRSTAKPLRLIELIHRAIPYPVILIVARREEVNISLAHKRWSQGEIGKVVIEDIRYTESFYPEPPTKLESSFLASLKISKLPRTNLFTLYQGWLDCIAALEAAQVTGIFAIPDSVERSKALRTTLDEHALLCRDITALRGQAEKEKQLNRRVELNLKIKQLEAELKSANEKLQFRNVE